MSQASINMQDRIHQKLKAALSAKSQIEVINESHLHSGHAGDDGSGESHFSAKITSVSFNDLSRVARERMIFEILADEMKVIHALSLALKPAE